MKLSVVLTSYNYSQYISESIESVLSQSFSDFELIIIEDCSTDSSLDIIYDYAKRDCRIRVIEHKKNFGVHYSVIEGFHAARGKFYHALSADDKYQPGFLEKTMNYFNAHPEIGLCCSDFGYFLDQEPEKIFSTKLIDSTTTAQVFTPLNITSAFRKKNFWIPGHTTIVKKQLITDYGLYNPDLYALTDWYLLHTIAFFEGAGYIPETLSTMRLHQNSYSSSCKKDLSTLKKTHQNLIKILEHPKNIELKKKFKQSALLGFLFKDLQCLKHPKLWSFYPALIKKSFKFRWINLLKRLNLWR